MTPSRSASARLGLASLTVAAIAGGPAIAAGGTGLSVTPPTLEHPARAGVVGAVTIGNATGAPLNITVAARPWTQLASGSAVPNPRLTLRAVRLSAAAFTLADGASKVVSLSLLSVPKSGSVYGNIDVTGVPTTPSHAPNGLNFEYRLVSSLRLDPLHAKLGARVGGAIVAGTHRAGSLALAITNTGNTIAPIGGTARIRGARGAVTGSIPVARILPGGTVDAKVIALHGSLPSGSYTLSVSLSEGGHRLLNANRRFKLR